MASSLFLKIIPDIQGMAPYWPWLYAKEEPKSSQVDCGPSVYANTDLVRIPVVDLCLPPDRDSVILYYIGSGVYFYAFFHGKRRQAVSLCAGKKGIKYGSLLSLMEVI